MLTNRKKCLITICITTMYAYLIYEGYEYSGLLCLLSLSYISTLVMLYYTDSINSVPYADKTPPITPINSPIAIATPVNFDALEEIITINIQKHT